MVRFTVLASGSKGNCTVLTGGRTKILVDAGLSCREIFRRMKLAGEDPAALDAIIVTHDHQDHVNGVALTARKLGIPVYFTEGTHRAWMRWLAPRRQMTYGQWLELCRKHPTGRAEASGESAMPPEPAAESTPVAVEAFSMAAHATAANPSLVGAEEPAQMAWNSAPSGEARASALDDPAEDDPAEDEDSARSAEAQPGGSSPARDELTWLPAVEYFQPGQPFAIGDIGVHPFTVPHDAADPVGFVFTAEGVRMGYATDLGYIPPNVKEQLRRLDLLLLESNHDLEMLRDGPYPWQVKQRVLSRVGHLSNEAAAQFLAEDYDGQAAWIVLAHLSESNNLPELAQVAAERALAGQPSLIGNHLLIARQHEPLSSIDF